METIAFLGVSRGLGRACFEILDSSKELSSLLVSRKRDILESMVTQARGQARALPFDLSFSERLPTLVQELKAFSPQRVFYFAGGGCYGDFASKAWKDHMWGLQVSFLTPAFLLHQLLQDPPPQLQQLVFVGSQIADATPDPQASSYCAAKQGLRGLITTIQKERPRLDLRWLRPGYLDTDLLPPQAHPRLNKEAIMSLAEAAERFSHWVLDPCGERIYDL